MENNPQNRIIAKLEKQITDLKAILEETIVQHSDAEYDLKDLKISLEELSDDKFDNSSDKMLVMSNEWEDVE